jgi:hypothetical protein
MSPFFGCSGLGSGTVVRRFVYMFMSSVIFESWNRVLYSTVAHTLFKRHDDYVPATTASR